MSKITDMSSLMEDAKSWFAQRERKEGKSVIQINKFKSENGEIKVYCTIHFAQNENTKIYNRDIIASFTDDQRQQLIAVKDMSERKWGTFTDCLDSFISQNKRCSISEFLTNINEKFIIDCRTNSEKWKVPVNPQEIKSFNNPFDTIKSNENQSRFRIDADDDLSTFRKPNETRSNRDDMTKSNRQDDIWYSKPKEEEQPKPAESKFRDFILTDVHDSRNMRDDSRDTRPAQNKFTPDNEYSFLMKEKEKSIINRSFGESTSVTAMNVDVIDNWVEKLNIKLPEAKFFQQDNFSNTMVLWANQIPDWNDPIANYKHLTHDIRTLLLIPGIVITFNPTDLKEFEIELGPQFFRRDNAIQNVLEKNRLAFKVINFTKYYGYISSVFIPRFFHPSVFPLVLAMEFQKSLVSQICDLRAKLQTVVNWNSFSSFQPSDIKVFDRTFEMLTIFYINQKHLKESNEKEFMKSDAFHNIVVAFVAMLQHNCDISIMNHGDMYQFSNFASFIINSNYNLQDRSVNDIMRKQYIIIYDMMTVVNKQLNDPIIKKLIGYLEIHC